MGLKHAGAFLALMALCAPAPAFDGVQTVFYVSIPLDRSASAPSFGLRLQDGREHRAIEFDTRMLRFLPAGGLEAKWLIAGAVALGAAAALQGDKRAEQRAELQSGPGASPQPCPQVCN
jgi:hypothetical protein